MWYHQWKLAKWAVILLCKCIYSHPPGTCASKRLMCYQAANSRGTLVDEAELKCHPGGCHWQWQIYGPNFMYFFLENLAKSYVGTSLEGWHPHLWGILDLPLISIQYTHTQVFLTRNNACGLSGTHQYASDSCGIGLTYYDTSTYHITIPSSQLHSQKHLL